MTTKESPPPARRADGRFKPGVSGNPGGRTKYHVDVKEAFIRMTPKAVALLERILDDATVDLKFRIRAAETVLDRVLGPVGRGGEVVALEQRDGSINVIELVRLPRSQQDGRDDDDDNGT